MTNSSPRVAIVLGGGGLKGFAHIGLLQVLEERGIRPAVWAGTSIGALLAVASACGVSTHELAERAARLRRRDLFRINHVGMIVDRMRSASLYLEDPLRELVSSVVPHRRFRDLAVPALVSTVDLEHATQVVWGLPGLRDAYMDDAVYASCALPGFFPPGRVENRWCIDGGTIDNLPGEFAATLGVDVVIACDVGSSELPKIRHITRAGFAAIFMRAASVMMGALQNRHLEAHSALPMLLVRPALAGIDLFTFGRSDDAIAAGREATERALLDLDRCLDAPDGIYPRRTVSVSVDRQKCISCGICVAMAPEVMQFDEQRKAVPRQLEWNWSPADGDFARHCPTSAITVQERGRAEDLCDPPTDAPPRRRPRIRRRA